MPAGRLAFTVAAALVALHAATDAFFAPERGTAWSDHLLSGGVSVGLVAAAALLWPHLRPGAQAAVAVALGALAIEGAALALADARSVGARGDDWTGFLLAPAGLALVLLGLAILWSSRKRYGRRYVRRALLAVGALVGAFVVVLPVGIAIGATHRPRAPVPADADLGRPYRDVTVRTRDGLELAGWYVPSQNGAAIVSFPTRKGKLPQARMLARHGYGVLLLDMRGYEGSEGDPNAFGWGAARDIDAAVAWLGLQPDVERGRIGGIGFSVGGELMIEAAAENPGLRAVVSEGAGERSFREALVRGVRGALMLPTSAVQTAALTVLSNEPPPPSLKDAVAKVAPRSLFLVYAGRSGAGEDINPTYFRAAHEPKAIWKIPEAHHVGGFDARPQEYERRVVGFFDRALR
ncbi:MAG: alpha/beta hydrolase, partial [Gaiellaceae bacterium]